jgi:integrase/recombinase XerD
MEHQTPEGIIDSAIIHLQKLAISQGTIIKYHATWKQLLQFIKDNQINSLNAASCECFLQTKFGNYDYSELTKPQKSIVRRVTFLVEYQENGYIMLKRNEPQKPILDKPLGREMAHFLEQNINIAISQSTLRHYKCGLKIFQEYLEDKHIIDLDSINQYFFFNFIREYRTDRPNVKHNMLCLLRCFFRFLYDNKMTDTDLSRKIPSDHYKRYAKLPSFYTKNEIERLINAIDRSSAIGKRDYAIMLLATSLGLRSSDIRLLNFHNIDWQSCSIRLTQHKTGNELLLPLSDMIGKAIIDYLKYGRPKSESPFVFLRHIPPYYPLHATTMSTLTSIYLCKAGVKTDNKKKGMHVLRHSLAGQLLINKTPLPVISEILGHKDTGSTMYYLRIDLDSMRQCSLEVPSVGYGFYTRILKDYFRQR